VPADVDAAIAALETYPALVESRRRLLRATRGERDLTEVLAAIESDPALTLATLRRANARAGRRGEVASVLEAIQVLDAGTLGALAEAVAVTDRFAPGEEWGSLPERFRVHAVGVSRLAQRLAEAVGMPASDELITAALVHDAGELVLHRADGGAAQALPRDATPEARLEAERETYGLDHAQAGAELARRWDLPERLAAAIESHHVARDGPVGVLSLADALSYYGEGGPVDLEALVTTAETIGMDRADLGELMYELPHPLVRRRRVIEPCPLSLRELDVMCRLADGMLPKQIAIELGLSPSTVRNHLHRIYTRLGAADRTQAVLIVRERGWI
jgi:putative nucleotidyltransferase with HDIG domain